MIVIRFLLLVAIWLLLWSDISAANVLSGMVVAALIILMFPGRIGELAIRPFAAVRFFVYFAVRVVVTSLSVARTVIAPRDRIQTGVLEIPLTGCSDAVATLVADAISLTPGTLTLEVRKDPLTLYVHALDLRDVDQVRKDVRKLEVLAIRAFGSPDAIAGLVDDDSQTWRGR